MDDPTREAIMMISGEDEDLLYGDDLTIGVDDITVGRMSEGLDESDFDEMRMNRVFETPNRKEGAAGDELDLLSGDDDEAVPFEPPTREIFPTFKRALAYFRKVQPKARAVRVDTEETYEDFVGVKAADEVARRIEEAMQAHEADPFAHKAAFAEHIRRLHHEDEVLGALAKAKDGKDALEAFPKVPLDLPPFAEGKIKCWRQGKNVICSIAFGTPEGKRIATMAATPRVDGEEIFACVERAGIDPVTILGALPDLAAVATGKRLVREVAGAALEAQRRADICIMGDEPVMLVREPVEDPAPLAALMYVEQLAETGDPQAQQEITILEAAAKTTPAGRKVALPALADARRRLAAGWNRKRAQKRLASWWGRTMNTYSSAAGWR